MNKITKRYLDGANNNSHISKKQKKDAIKEIANLALETDKEMDLVEETNGVKKKDVEMMDSLEKKDAMELEEEGGIENMDHVEKENKMEVEEKEEEEEDIGNMDVENTKL